MDFEFSMLLVHECKEAAKWGGIVTSESLEDMAGC